MQATRTVRDAGKVAGMKGRRLQEGQDPIIHRWTCKFHEVIDQRIMAVAIGAQEAAR